MAGRNINHAHMLHLRDQQASFMAQHVQIHNPNALRPPPHRSIVLEDHLAAQHHDIQTLLRDNQRLVAVDVALKEDLSAAKLELRRVSATAASLKVDRDAHIREVYDRSHQLETELRSLDAAAAELVQVRSDIQKLTSSRHELSLQLQTVKEDLAKAQKEAQEALMIQAEIEGMHKELQRGRAAIEYEKKTHIDNLEQSQAMEKNMFSMAHEVEKLRAELANAEKRARAAAAAATAANPGPILSGTYGNSEVVYGGSSYSDVYGMYQAHSATESNPQYGSGALSSGIYDMQRTHAQGTADGISEYGSSIAPHGGRDAQRADIRSAADSVSHYGYAAVSHGAYDAKSHGGSVSGLQHGPGVASHGAYDMQQS